VVPLPAPPPIACGYNRTMKNSKISTIRPLKLQRREHRRTLDDDIVDAVKRATTPQQQPRAAKLATPAFLSPVGPESTE
jgi:hypothetical protein